MLKRLCCLAAIAVLLNAGTCQAATVYNSVYDGSLPEGHGPVLGAVVWQDELFVITARALLYSSSYSGAAGLPFDLPNFLPGNIKVAPDSLIALEGDQLLVVGSRNHLYDLDLSMYLTVPPLVGVSLPVAFAWGMAGDPAGNVFVSADGGIYKFRPQSGVADLVFGSDVGAIAIGPGGFVYGIDRANNQIKRFNANDGTAAGSFALTGTVDPTALVIGLDGRLYVADGNGGGLIYDSLTGAFLGTLSSAVTNVDEVGGHTSLALDSRGALYLWDANTGVHVFDVATPEPSTTWMLGAILIAFGLNRRSAVR